MEIQGKVEQAQEIISRLASGVEEALRNGQRSRVRHRPLEITEFLSTYHRSVSVVLRRNQAFAVE